MITKEECMNFKSIGRLNPGIEAKIIDPITNAALPVNTHGELVIKSVCIMKGYLGDNKATSECLDSEGWLKTGDLCYFDNEGFLYIVDRFKELIKYKGYQVPPFELEQVLLTSSDISDAAVIPYPDEESGQLPMAMVVRKEGSKISAMEIMDFVAKQVAPYKKIRKVSFVDSIPKSASGKILRRQLISQVISNGGRKMSNL
ncbi:hypothetical protein ZOSMA_506G00010 [Zostera marina]|uniref:4-coumarate--CoA ligase n=1 Tax=Zostera marina TaxID=29655 RepID=A0A0K9P0F1_ZOSMR|nr:hypothetical protein ZOSMA_506G00010 [Zostera marina]